MSFVSRGRCQDDDSVPAGKPPTLPNLGELYSPKFIRIELTIPEVSIPHLTLLSRFDIAQVT